MGGPQVLGPHLVLELVHQASQRLFQRRVGQLGIKEIQRLDVLADEPVRPLEFLLELGLGREIPRHVRCSLSSDGPHPRRVHGASRRIATIHSSDQE